jgi:hypothetical protein
VEFAGRGAHLSLGVPDVPRHRVGNGRQEPLDFSTRSLRYQMHAAVGEIADKARHLKFAGKAASVPPKTDPLDLARIVDFAADFVGFGHAPIVAAKGGREEFSQYQLSAPEM